MPHPDIVTLRKLTVKADDRVRPISRCFSPTLPDPALILLTYPSRLADADRDVSISASDPAASHQVEVKTLTFTVVMETGRCCQTKKTLVTREVVLFVVDSD